MDVYRRKLERERAARESGAVEATVNAIDRAVLQAEWDGVAYLGRNALRSLTKDHPDNVARMHASGGAHYLL